MEVDVARPAATFEYELASKDMILVPPPNGRKASALPGVPNERRARLDCPHSATATLELFQERSEMFREGIIDPIVPGP
jgi:hypothetical protein